MNLHRATLAALGPAPTGTGLGSAGPADPEAARAFADTLATVGTFGRGRSTPPNDQPTGHPQGGQETPRSSGERRPGRADRSGGEQDGPSAPALALPGAPTFTGAPPAVPGPDATSESADSGAGGGQPGDGGPGATLAAVPYPFAAATPPPPVLPAAAGLEPSERTSAGASAGVTAVPAGALVPGPVVPTGTGAVPGATEGAEETGQEPRGAAFVSSPAPPAALSPTGRFTLSPTDSSLLHESAGATQYPAAPDGSTPGAAAVTTPPGTTVDTPTGAAAATSPGTTAADRAVPDRGGAPGPNPTPSGAPAPAGPPANHAPLPEGLGTASASAAAEAAAPRVTITRPFLRHPAPETAACVAATEPSSVLTPPLVATRPTDPTTAPPVARQLTDQLTPQVVRLRSLPDGTHRLVLRVTPDEMGPVRVVAQIRGGALQLELHATTPAGRAALEVAAPLVRADLARVAPTATLDLGQSATGGSPDGRNPFGPGGDGAASGRREHPYQPSPEAVRNEPAGVPAQRRSPVRPSAASATGGADHSLDVTT